MHWFTLILVIGIILYIALPKLKQPSLDSTSEAIKEGACLIDVRTPKEYGQQSVPGSINLPLGQLTESMQQQNISKDSTLIVFCLSGTRSAAAEKKLKEMGYENVLNAGSYTRALKAWELAQPNLD